MNNLVRKNRLKQSIVEIVVEVVQKTINGEYDCSKGCNLEFICTEVSTFLAMEYQ
jgi:hypothetical protein